jgi:uncharacterized phage protein gp47/JayE
MTFAAEPYTVFVDDLVSALTGGIVRDTFLFVPEAPPFQLSAGSAYTSGTIGIQGIADGVNHTFQPGTDFTVAPDGTIQWQTQPGTSLTPAAGATLPDLGTLFYASYEPTIDPQALPPLTDRNPGSIVRTLAESFAREYAVLSSQLQLVYQAGFLQTATGPDLDQIAALVGLTRRTGLTAVGEVVFSRSTPAPANITIPLGTLVSSSDVPPVTAATTADCTLLAGALSVTAPVAAQLPGSPGTAQAGTLTVIHRPILGIEAASNPEPLLLGAPDETDAALRLRCSRALETSGASTVDAITGALTTIPQIQEQDVLVIEDHLNAPGVINVIVAPQQPLTAEQTQFAEQLLDGVRPAGILLLSNLPPVPVPPAPGQQPPPPPPSPAPAPPGPPNPALLQVAVSAMVTPQSLTLTPTQQAGLEGQVTTALQAAADQLGVGDTVVHNALVAAAMSVQGVYDVAIDVTPAGQPTVQANVEVPQQQRAALSITVQLRAAPVAFDLAVAVMPLGTATLTSKQAALAEISADIQRRLATAMATVQAPITAASFLGVLTDTPTYQVNTLSYRVEYVTEGLRVSTPDAQVVPTSDQVLWIRSVQVTES